MVNSDALASVKVFVSGSSFQFSSSVWLAESVNRQHQTPQRGDRSLGLATADKEESAELHSGYRIARLCLPNQGGLLRWNQGPREDLPSKGGFSNE